MLSWVKLLKRVLIARMRNTSVTQKQFHLEGPDQVL